jgi:two-component system response regulator PilR (NtrC family)
MQEVFQLVHQVAPTRANVLITGESGTGKELIARAVHNLSDRKLAPFVAVNCGAIPENLLESELFGHVKGSFTGASANKPGLFEVADGGTLFLDEIGEMALSLQVKVLRAIQHRTFQRVGGTSEIHVDVRIVCSTNRRLDVEVREGRFREDLFYRLNVIEIQLPPLRERLDDLPQLVSHFMDRFSRELGKDVRELDPAVMPVLESYPFPGNVRELENIVERAVTLARTSRLTPDCLPATVRRPAESAPQARIPEAGVDLDGLLAAYESSLIREALQRTGGVKKRAAQLLGVTFRSLRYRLEKLHLDDGGPSDASGDEARHRGRRRTSTHDGTHPPCAFVGVLDPGATDTSAPAACPRAGESRRARPLLLPRSARQSGDLERREPGSSNSEYWYSARRHKWFACSRSVKVSR